MRFEKRVMVLCAEALVADDDGDVRKLLAELRLVLHQHIEQLRTGLLASYSASITSPVPAKDSGQPTIVQPAPQSDGVEDTFRTWQQVVHEIASEKDHRRARHLSGELSRMLQAHDSAADAS